MPYVDEVCITLRHTRFVALQLDPGHTLVFDGPTPAESVGDVHL